MYKQYFKQALATLKENPLLSFISIVGTALAIAMIMVLVIAFEVRTANYRPETNRDRMLYATKGNYVSENNNSSSSNSFHLIKEVFYPISTAEAVTAVSLGNERLVSISAGRNEYKAEVCYTDERFWKVFDFRFLAGKPFTEDDVQSGIKKAVINEAIARGLYGSTYVVGKPILISYTEYTICGVVPAVSTLAEAAYAEVWVPHTTTTFPRNHETENTTGSFNCYILARSPKDFPLIREEAERLLIQLNATLSKGEYRLNGQPENLFLSMYRQGNMQADGKRVILRYAIILFILLLVPTINLSGMTLSRMKKRMPEIGVRKAFGATTGKLLWQILYENLILTIIGGLLGLIISYLAVTLMSDWLLATEMSNFREGALSINVEMLVNPKVFIYAFLFCLVLNLLSAGIPAWRASRENIVYALNEI
ncbi:putative ABC transport system permease protein [Parabacteroides sp. PF5-5]|uniref:ABC transporter permease n=1 Tax=unclassified Parabacteroides TaxID=2649774 RepID=UPI002476E8B9|nr:MULTISPECIES: ABC transporter permease [unclassified Parabacteroides]MDH6305280.1 putative ABC transport system permease protein [Parabacteroides sp. PH5-39]MDH6316633.1 putative ABC transport system permease protein [Parabacteroides sp. PF5-13]MDH6320187.1 putative ABC transport system permease protein [Parabacteroides sp. PH5-13]MDH6323870.1 putative ABC transport system permease protein [Parabacteroides sp. PH5-8]MDH6327864.1 putative ABC transport system permease protein [Parabacteroide